MKKVEVLISAMYQRDFLLFENTKIETSALMVNQCDVEEYKEMSTSFGVFKSISTRERGLSRSRNMALENSSGDYCLLCDDDEVLYKGYCEKILSAYQQYPDADIICFQIKREGKKYAKKAFKVNKLKSLQISSCQISLKLDSISKTGIKFDTGFGSGTPIGSGEENIFLFDCLNAGLNIYYVPVLIGEVAQMKSNWFEGFTEKYFINKGIISTRMMGVFVGSMYCMYFAISKFSRYKDNLSFGTAVKMMRSGQKKYKEYMEGKS